MRLFNRFTGLFLYMALITLVTIALLQGASVSQAQSNALPTTWYVATWGNDDNDCQTWRTACRTINNARIKAAEGDVIHIGPGVFRETLLFFTSVTLVGSGPNRTIVDGRGEDTVFTIYDGAAVHISRMTIRNGLGTDVGRGGGITNWGTLTLDHVVITNNKGAGGTMIGGLTSSGPVTVTNSAIVNNDAPGGYGGVLVEDQAYMENVTIANNTGLENGRGGGIYITANAKATLVNVTVSGNKAFFGAGGIANAGETHLLNVTVANNRVESPADRVREILNDGRLTLRNTLIAGPCLGIGTFISQGHNVEADNTCALTHSTDMRNTDPEILPLAYNGGIGETHALKPSSPAVDAGDNGACPNTDQRGMARRDGNGDGQVVCDIGAYEYNPPNTQPQRSYVALVY